MCLRVPGGEPIVSVGSAIWSRITRWRNLPRMAPFGASRPVSAAATNEEVYAVGRSLVPLRAVRYRQPPTSTALASAGRDWPLPGPFKRRDPGLVTAADLAKVGPCLSLFGTVGAFQRERAAIAIALDQSALSEKVTR